MFDSTEVVGGIASGAEGLQRLTSESKQQQDTSVFAALWLLLPTHTSKKKSRPPLPQLVAAVFIRLQGSGLLNGIKYGVIRWHGEVGAKGCGRRYRHVFRKM